MALFRRQTPVWKDAVLGAVAGGVASAVMIPVMARLQQLERPEAKDVERALAPNEPPNAKVARKAAEFVGIELPEEAKQQGGKWVHYGYGMFWGAVFGALYDRLPLPRPVEGLLFGAFLALFSEVLLLPSLKLAPPAHRFKVDTHLAGLGAHLVYGASAERSFALMKKALA